MFNNRLHIKGLNFLRTRFVINTKMSTVVSNIFRYYLLLNNRIMKVNECAALILDAVKEDTDVEPHQVLSKCGNTDVVDARYITVYILHENGYSAGKISSAMRISTRYVQHIVSNFHSRIKYNKVVRNFYERIKKKLRITSELEAQ